MNLSSFFSSKNIKIGILLFLVAVAFIRHKPTIISWDVLAHYLYLPTTFIYDDPGIQKHDELFAKIEQYGLSSTFYQVIKHETGNHIIKTTCGLSILHSPFFLGAHVVALLGSAPADGFSAPYQFAMMLSSLFFIFIGLIYLRKTIRYLFDDKTALYTLILLVFGTNLFSIYIFLTSIHLYLFGLYAFLIWKTIRWHEDPNRMNAFLIGITTGFITLLRPTDAISNLIPLLWGVFDLSSFRKKVLLLLTHWNHVLMLLLGGVITIIPQLIYWKMFTGHFLFYSYATPGEGLDFLTPYISQVLFSFRKGWFVYTPLMLFAIAGFITLYRQHKHIFYPVLVYTIINVYLISCWTCWWYAGSFGHRAFVHSYALLAIPLASLVYDLINRKRLLTYLLFFVMFMFLFLNLFQTWQYNRRIIDASRMTKEYYLAVFGKMKAVDDKTSDLLLLERSIIAEDFAFDKSNYFIRKSITVDFSKIPDIPSERIIVDSAGSSYLVLDSNYIFTPAFQIPYHHLSEAEHLYFVIRSQVYYLTDPIANPVSLVVHFAHKGGAYKYRAVDSHKGQSELLLNNWYNLEYTYLSPDIRNSADEFTTYFWHRGKQPVYVRNIEIEVWEPTRGW